MATFSSFLRTLRQERRLTLGQLALRAGVNKATLSRWESGTYQPRIPELLLVLDALKATPTMRTQCLQLLEVPRAIIAERGKGNTQGSTRLSLGDFLYGLRQRSGKPQEEAARAVGVSRSLYGQWESDTSRPPAWRAGSSSGRQKPRREAV